MNYKLFFEIAEEAKDVSGGMLTVLFLLAGYANDKGECWPRTRKVAYHCHITPGHARYLLRALIKLGYVRVLARATPHTPPRYLVRIPREGEVEVNHLSVAGISAYPIKVNHLSVGKVVPAQAGTVINHKKEHKERPFKKIPLSSAKEDVPKYDPGAMVPCQKEGCNSMTSDGWCKDHRPVGYLNNVRRGGRKLE